MSLASRAYDATWGRAFARLYDRMLADTEEAGLRDRRRELLARAGGRTLELGAGTGLNLDLYPSAVDELVLTEPFGPMAERLRHRIELTGRPVEVLEAPGERIPVEDGSFDTVVSTLVLCTVEDVGATLAEVHRILRPGGVFLFCEHVRSEERALARWQDRLEPVWRFVGHGCHPNRDTVASIAGSPLTLGEVERGRLPKSPAITRPLAVGSARRTG